MTETETNANWLRSIAGILEREGRFPLASHDRARLLEIAGDLDALKVAQTKARGTLANNLCPDHRDKQSGKPCLACEVERLNHIADRLVCLPATTETAERIGEKS